MDVERSLSNTGTQAPFNVRLRHANQGTYRPFSFLSKKEVSDSTKVIKDYTYIHVHQRTMSRFCFDCKCGNACEPKDLSERQIQLSLSSSKCW